MEENYNKHYIKVDDQGRIVDGWSDGPHSGKDTTGAICINEEGGYQFRLYVKFLELSGEPYHMRTEENPVLFDRNGIPLYKYKNGEIVSRSEEEIAADVAAIPAPGPTAAERLEAQVTYTAMMTDTLIEEV